MSLVDRNVLPSVTSVSSVVKKSDPNPGICQVCSQDFTWRSKENRCWSCETAHTKEKNAGTGAKPPHFVLGMTHPEHSVPSVSSVVEKKEKENTVKISAKSAESNKIIIELYNKELSNLQIAEKLNADGIKPPKSSSWTATNISVRLSVFRKNGLIKPKRSKTVKKTEPKPPATENKDNSPETKESEIQFELPESLPSEPSVPKNVVETQSEQSVQSADKPSVVDEVLEKVFPSENSVSSVVKSLIREADNYLDEAELYHDLSLFNEGVAEGLNIAARSINPQSVKSA